MVLEPIPLKSILTFGELGSSEGMFKHPGALAVSDRDEIAAMDSNDRMQIFDRSGKFIRSFGQQGTSH